MPGRGRPGRGPRLSVDMGLRMHVQAKRDLEWSPDQIAAHLRLAFLDKSAHRKRGCSRVRKPPVSSSDLMT